MIAPDLFRLDPDGLTLVGGWSPTSGVTHFPRNRVCPLTGADDVVPVDLPRTGRLWLWTTVTAAPPGYFGPVPYGFGVVEVDPSPGGTTRIVGRLTVTNDDPRLAAGAPMRVVAVDLPVDAEGTVATTWAFAPEEP